MAQIKINEISQNYLYSIGTNSYATIAMPITAAWGPAFQDTATVSMTLDEMLEETAWSRFPATQAGIEAFASTFRGPAAGYRLANDYSYQMAMTLLTAGHDVLVCRLCPGTMASKVYRTSTVGTIEVTNEEHPGTSFFLQHAPIDINTLRIRVNDSDVSQSEFGADGLAGDDEDVYLLMGVDGEAGGREAGWVNRVTGEVSISWIPEEGVPITMSWATYTYSGVGPTEDGLDIKAKYPGTFGNNLSVKLVKIPSRNPADASTTNSGYWNIITYLNTGTSRTAVENLLAVFDPANATDTIPHISEVKSNFLTFNVTGSSLNEASTFYDDIVMLTGGSDRADESSKDIAGLLADAVALATDRYNSMEGVSGTQYLEALAERTTVNTDKTQASNIKYNEWLYTNACHVYDLLKDRLTYNPNRIISPGWDDQDIQAIIGGDKVYLESLSPLHIKLMDTGYYSRCGTAILDIPKSLARKYVYNESTSTGQTGYAQMLSRRAYTMYDSNSALYATHSALAAPWGQYQYVGTAKQNAASPAFQLLMIQRAMILNQPAQFEWALPTNRKHNLNLGQLDYNISTTLLDAWQSLEGVGVNAIANIPDLGVTLWGNSTLIEVPPATYQALANLSTRYLINAIEDVAYRCGISITFQYNNQDAYDKFYAGVSPLLDTMRNVGAISDYYIRMAADLNGLDSVNANSVIGQIYLTINGVINNITIDMIALPPGVDLNQYRA